MDARSQAPKPQTTGVARGDARNSDYTSYNLRLQPDTQVYTDRWPAWSLRSRVLGFVV